MSETETRDADDDGALLRSIAQSIRPAFPEAADLLLGIESMHWPTEAHRQHEAAIAARAEAQRLRHLLGSHADGHRCTCTELDPGKPGIEPPEWEQDPWCPMHPDVDYIAAELSRLRGVVEAVQALADELRAMENLPPAHWIEARLRAVLAPVSSSGEAESGEGDPAAQQLLRDIFGKHEDDPTPAPVPSGGQADGQGEGRGREKWEVYRDAFQAVSAERDALRELLDLAARPVLSREALLLALARADGQAWGSLAEADPHTAEVMYGKQADAVLDVLHPQDGGQR